MGQPARARGGVCVGNQDRAGLRASTRDKARGRPTVPVAARNPVSRQPLAGEPGAQALWR